VLLAELLHPRERRLAYIGWECHRGEGTVPLVHSEKARRRAARQLVGEYHERELARLLEHVRDAFTRFDAGEIDAFELDDLIHRYKRSARELWKFCANRPESIAWAIEDARSRCEAINWWAAGEPRRRSSGDD
jgi:hypothetical protein